MERALIDLETGFGIGAGTPRTCDNALIDVTLRLLGGLGLDAVPSDASGLSDMTAAVDAKLTDINRLRLQLEDELRSDVCNPLVAEMNRRVVRLGQLAYYSGHVVKLLMSVDEKLLSSNSASNCDFEKFCELVQPYRPPCDSEESVDDGVKLTKLQKLLLHVLRYCWQHGYRRNEDAIYEQIRCDGRPIGAWKRVCTLEELVYRAAKRSESFDQWLNLTGAMNNAGAAAQYLKVCDDFELPDVQKSRHVFAFSDGIYVSNENAFYLHGELPPRLADMAAANFFKTKFPRDVFEAEDWKHAETPHFQSILDYQDFHTETGGVDHWMYVFIGRLLYELGSHDCWQVIPYLRGAAGSGKSTILLNVCKLLFDEADVGVLSNNIEKKFGLWSFFQKKLFIAPEIKTDLHLDQAEFQSLVSGDAMQIAQKHLQAETVSWKVPGIMAGNEVPAWRDASGSITRRIALFHFSKSVTEVDTQLGEKLRAEVPRLLVKCNRAYLKAVETVGSKNIWSVLPDYFRDTQKDLQACVDSLWNFMSSGDLEFDSDYYMPWAAFLDKYRTYCKDNNLTFVPLNKTSQDTYKRTLSNFKCQKEGVRVERFYPRFSTLPADKRVGFWLIGADEPPSTSSFRL